MDSIKEVKKQIETGISLKGSALKSLDFLALNLTE